MAGTNWGMAAGGAQDAMQQMLEERILKEKMALAQRQQQAEEAYRAAQLAEQAAGRGDVMSRHKDTFGESVRQFNAGEPGRALDNAGKMIDNNAKMGDNVDKGVLRARRDTARTGLAQDKTWAPTIRLLDAGVPLDGADQFDPDGSIKNTRRLGEITAQGDQQVRVAGVQSANNPRYTQTKDGVDQDGKPVSLGLTRDGRWEPIATPDGTSVRSPATKVTGAQDTAGRFFARAEQAIREMEAVEPQLMTLMAQAGGLTPNIMQSSEWQLYKNSLMRYTEARLRKDSGAAVPPQEYENDAKAYGIVFGDKTPVLLQKRAAKRSTVAPLAYEARGALDNYYGEERAQQLRDEYRPVAPDAAGGQTQTRTIRNKTTGETKTQTSTDGGQTWK